jgi:hypothetical protein
MPINFADSHAHKVFPPARTMIPKTAGGFISYPKTRRSINNKLPPMTHASTSILVNDMRDQGTSAKGPSRFASLASTSSLKADSSMVMSVTKSTASKSMNKNNYGGKKKAPMLVSSFSSAMDEKHRERMAQPVQEKTFTTGETQTTYPSDKWDFDNMSVYNTWVKESVEPFLSDLRRHLLINKPKDIEDFVSGYCTRICMGQPQSSDMSALNRAKKGPKGVPRRSVIVTTGIAQSRGNEVETQLPSISKECSKDSEEDEREEDGDDAQTLFNSDDPEGRDRSDYVRRYAMVTSKPSSNMKRTEQNNSKSSNQSPSETDSCGPP